MALAFAPPIDGQGHVGDEGPVVEAQGMSGLTAEEEVWAAENLAEFMRETEPERLIEAEWLAVQDQEAQATLDSALASILIFSVADGVTGGRFLTGPIDFVDGVVVQTPEYSTEEYDIEHVTF